MEHSIPTIEDTLKLPGALLWRASKLWQNAMHSTLTDLGLSSTNAIVLSNILRLELEHKKVTQGGLADLCGIDRMTASTILRTLIEKGFITRKVDQADKRIFELSLTDEGRIIAREALRRIAVMHQKFFESIDAKNLAQLVDSLSMLLDSNDVDRKNKEENDH